MDLFRFTTRSAHIDSLSLVKDIEEELRSLRDILKFSSKLDDLTDMIRPFQLFTKCFEKLEIKSNRRMPDFLYTARNRAATEILHLIVESTRTFSYEEYIDIFKYCKTVPLELPSSSRNSKLAIEAGFKQLIVLAKIIKDKPNPYIFRYSSVYPGNAYIDICYNNFIAARILQALAIRQTICNDMNYTVIEDFLNDHKLRKAELNLVRDTEIIYNAAKEFEFLLG